ncbi:PREDICTED: leucine-rich repeat-containing protein let-4-like, partial [Branchiostoma belcheri]|uniref:Leucine-rich repeat-containing protein let-4-like n=1 Tax=Branchiostoma belcheri TaxID=7741 RepID=A0A6P4XMF1_BRABE
MGRKLRHVLIFLLIILKEPSMPEVVCSCKPSSGCWCNRVGLTSIPQNLPTSISGLHLGDNFISSIQTGAFANLTRLQSLDLSSNQITKIQSGTFANLPELQVLSLCLNQISELQLQYLCLSGNQITEIQPGALANLPQLQELNLRSSQIKIIQAGTFSNLPRLQLLNLFFNRITTIHSKAFESLPQLQTLYLRKNMLSAIPPSAFGLLPSIRTVTLAENPWRCDCRMASFRLNINTFPSFKDQIICTQPVKFRGQKLINVNPEEMICEETTVPTLSVYIQTSSAVSTSSVNKPESAPSFLLAVPISSVCGSVAGIVLMGIAILTIWYYKMSTRDPHLGPNPNVVGGSNGMHTVVASGHDQTGQGQSQANTESNTNNAATVMASCDDHQYEDIDKPRVKTRQCQSQTITESNTNTTVTVMTSDHYYQYDDTNNHHVQAGQGQSQANIQSLKVGNLSHDQILAALNPNLLYVSTNVASSDDQTGLGQSQTLNSQYTTATVMTSGHDQTGQGQYQAISEPLDTRHPCYGTGPIASQQNCHYNTATVMASGRDLNGQ